MPNECFLDATMGDGGKDGVRIQVSVSLDYSGEIFMSDAVSIGFWHDS